MDIYTIDFDPAKLSYKQEKLGMIFANLDTAVELMKKEEKMLIAELTLYYTKEGNYKNITELNGHIYSDEKFKNFFDRYQKNRKERNQAKIRCGKKRFIERNYYEPDTKLTNTRLS